MKKCVLFCMAAIVAVATSAKPQANLVDTIDVVCYDLQLNTDLIGVWGMTYIFANNSGETIVNLVDSVPHSWEVWHFLSHSLSAMGEIGG